jgi:hypothetical protein
MVRSIDGAPTVVVIRHPEHRAYPICTHQCDLALLLKACDDRVVDDLESSLQQNEEEEEDKRGEAR